MPPLDDDYLSIDDAKLIFIDNKEEETLEMNDEEFKTFWENIFKDEQGTTAAEIGDNAKLQKAADTLYAHYSCYLKAGFNEDQALCLVTSVIEALIENALK